LSLVIEVRVGGENQQPPPQARLDWARAEWSKMKEMAREWNWRDELRGTGAEGAWTRLREKVAVMIETCVPKKRMRNKTDLPGLHKKF
jgi:hypothetical protein